jgi:hypothetical protein
MSRSWTGPGPEKCLRPRAGGRGPGSHRCSLSTAGAWSAALFSDGSTLVSDLAEVETITQEWQERHAADLLGINEAADRLGMTPQRLGYAAATWAAINGPMTRERKPGLVTGASRSDIEPRW